MISTKQSTIAAAIATVLVPLASGPLIATQHAQAGWGWHRGWGWHHRLGSRSAGVTALGHGGRW